MFLWFPMLFRMNLVPLPSKTNTTFLLLAKIMPTNLTKFQRLLASAYGGVYFVPAITFPLEATATEQHISKYKNKPSASNLNSVVPNKCIWRCLFCTFLYKNVYHFSIFLNSTSATNSKWNCFASSDPHQWGEGDHGTRANMGLSWRVSVVGGGGSRGTRANMGIELSGIEWTWGLSCRLLVGWVTG